MPRLARTVFAHVPHHITQRGNRREKVFFTDADRAAYLDWLKEYAEKHAVEILAYCLMTNHIHLVAVPTTEDGLQKALKPLHMRYAQRINRARGWKGHVWQFSSALDETYLWAAVRYVERNPVRARMVRKAENYHWSSARGKRDATLYFIKPSPGDGTLRFSGSCRDVCESRAAARTCRRRAPAWALRQLVAAAT